MTLCKNCGRPLIKNPFGKKQHSVKGYIVDSTKWIHCTGEGRKGKKMKCLGLNLKVGCGCTKPEAK